MPKQPDQIIGSFTFRNEGDGCITSKYQHGDSIECPFTESCKLIDRDVEGDRFSGRYQTVWLEDLGNHEKIELLITRNPRNNRIYILNWYNPNTPSVSIFEGTAMLFENILVGAYWD